MTPGVLVDPGHLLVEGPRNHVEGDGRLGDLDVVDRTDGLGVSPLDESNREVGHVGGRYRALPARERDFPSDYP
jgi:hypothetical protein